MTTIQEQIRQTVLANPGQDANTIMALTKGVTDQRQCAAFLKFLVDERMVSRARIDGRFCYWPPGEAPADDALPGVDIDKIHTRGVDRAEQATSPDRSAGRGHTDGGGAAANPQSATPGSAARSPGAQGGPQPPLPIPRRPAEAMKAGGRTSAGPSPGATQSGRPAKIVTPDWTIYPLDDELLIMHKDTAMGFRLDAETVAAIREIAL